MSKDKKPVRNDNNKQAQDALRKALVLLGKLRANNHREVARET